MKLQIERLIVWPKKEGETRNEIRFELDCVNVLSGESRTGKSAVASIIDYCLGSSDCNVPIGRVRENVEWFGIVVVTDAGRLLLARRNPNEQASTSESLVKEINGDADIPDQIVSGPDSSDDITARLAQLGGIQDVGRGQFGFENQRLGFRDTTHLLFQVQDIVANRYILFYKMQKAEIMERFSAWFNFIIGAETLNDVVNRQKLDDLKRKLRQLEMEKERIDKKAISWNAKLRARMIQAQSFGFVYQDCEVPDLKDKKLLEDARKLFKRRAALCNVARPSGAIGESIDKLRVEIAGWMREVDKLEHELKDLKNIKATILEQTASTQFLHDRLMIAKWLKENAQPVQSKCPVCGGEAHEEAHAELDKIIKVVEDCERAIEVSNSFPAATLGEIQEKESRLRTLRGLIDGRNQQIAELFKLKDKETADYLNQVQRVSELFESLNMILELNQQLDSGIDAAKIKELKDEIKRIGLEFDEDTIKARETERLAKIGELALARLQTLDSEEQYRRHAPVFKKRDMNICIKDAHNKEHTLGEVGSASNWVALHIAVTCAFQEFFAGMKNPGSCVPNFIVYDQPSQVYFPSDKRVVRDLNATGGNCGSEDVTETDREAVRKIFCTLAQSIRETKAANDGHAWQAIVLEHAGEEIYGNIEGVHVLAPWRDGVALIPKRWYE